MRTRPCPAVYAAAVCATIAGMVMPCCLCGRRGVCGHRPSVPFVRLLFMRVSGRSTRIAVSSAAVSRHRHALPLMRLPFMRHLGTSHALPLLRRYHNDTRDGKVMPPFVCPGPRPAAKTSVHSGVASRAVFHAPPGLHVIAHTDRFCFVRGPMNWPPPLRLLGSTIRGCPSRLCVYPSTALRTRPARRLPGFVNAHLSPRLCDVLQPTLFAGFALRCDRCPALQVGLFFTVCGDASASPLLRPCPSHVTFPVMGPLHAVYAALRSLPRLA